MATDTSAAPGPDAKKPAAGKPAAPAAAPPGAAPPAPTPPAAAPATTSAAASKPEAPVKTSSTPPGKPAATAAAAPAAKPAPAAAPAAAPPPPPTPTGDFATLASAVPGASFGKTDDGEGVVTVPADELFTAARQVKQLGYRILSVLSSYDRADHFGTLYAFVKPAGTSAEFGEMRLRVVLPKQVDGKPVEPTCPSLCDVFPAADWHEREMYDMYGIRFEGHPDLRRMFLPDGWTGFPMRKDYREPEQFVAMREGEDIVVKAQEEGAW